MTRSYLVIAGNSARVEHAGYFTQGRRPAAAAAGTAGPVAGADPVAEERPGPPRTVPPAQGPPPRRRAAVRPGGQPGLRADRPLARRRPPRPGPPPEPSAPPRPTAQFCVPAVGRDRPRRIRAATPSRPPVPALHRALHQPTRG